MSYSNRFMRAVERYDGLGGTLATQTAEGLRQFHEKESRGVDPAAPDPYYLHLLSGKKWWEWTLNNIAEQYCDDDSGMWAGWLQYARDFRNDPEGFKQLRQRCGCSAITPQQILEELDGTRP